MGRTMLINSYGSDDSTSRGSCNISVDDASTGCPIWTNAPFPKVMQAVGTSACSRGVQHYHSQCRIRVPSVVLRYVARSCAAALAGASAVGTTGLATGDVVMDAPGASHHIVIQSFALQ